MSVAEIVSGEGRDKGGSFRLCSPVFAVFDCGSTSGARGNAAELPFLVSVDATASARPGDGGVSFFSLPLERNFVVSATELVSRDVCRGRPSSALLGLGGSVFVDGEGDGDGDESSMALAFAAFSQEMSSKWEKLGGPPAELLLEGLLTCSAAKSLIWTS